MPKNVVAETGLVQVGNAYFMWRSTTGKTHAINPKTKKTYCNRTVLQSWEPTDELVDNKHEPTCTICKRHCHDPIIAELEDVKRELTESINEFLTVQIWTRNANGGLGRFVEVIAKFMREENKRTKEERI
jgi:Pyruvate/2-oxoacid:ferredoxin oxidoreductase delta subunit